MYRVWAKIKDRRLRSLLLPRGALSQWQQAFTAAASAADGGLISRLLLEQVGKQLDGGRVVCDSSQQEAQL